GGESGGVLEGYVRVGGTPRPVPGLRMLLDALQASPFCFITFCRSSTNSAGDFGWAVVNTATRRVLTATRAPRLIDGRIVSFLSRGAARSDPAGGTAVPARSYSRADPAAGPGNGRSTGGSNTRTVARVPSN